LLSWVWENSHSRRSSFRGLRQTVIHNRVNLTIWMSRAFADNVSAATDSFEIIFRRVFSFAVCLIQILDIDFFRFPSADFLKTIWRTSKILMLFVGCQLWTGLNSKRRRYYLTRLGFHLFD